MFPFVGIARRGGNRITGTVSADLSALLAGGEMSLGRSGAFAAELAELAASGSVKRTVKSSLSAALAHLSASGTGSVHRKVTINSMSAALAKVAASGSLSIAPVPTISISSPVSSGTYSFTGADSSTESVSVSGTASGNGGTLSSVTYSVSGATTASGTASGTTSWSFSVNYAFGSSTVTVTANNSSGKTKSGSITIKRNHWVSLAQKSYSGTYYVWASGDFRPGPSGAVTWVIKRNGSAFDSGNCRVSSTDGEQVLDANGEYYTPGSGHRAWTMYSKSYCYLSGTYTIEVTVGDTTQAFSLYTF